MCENADGISGKHSRKPVSRPKNVPRSILLVDDNRDICRLNIEILTDSGYHVDAMHDGESALQALKMIQYDLVVTDNEMPGGTGVEMLKKLHASKATVPVIMATGTFPKAEFEMAPWIKPSIVLLKPYSIGDLLKAVHSILGRVASQTDEPSKEEGPADSLSLQNTFEPGLPVMIPIQNRES